MNKKAILCVDDEAIILMSIKQELKNHFKTRFLYETALNAEEALEIVNDLTDEGVTLILVISDWLMPGMKGDEFLRKIRNINPDIKTMMITGHAAKDALEAVEKENLADRILIKPWRNSQLISAVEEIIPQV